MTSNNASFRPEQLTGLLRHLLTAETPETFLWELRAIGLREKAAVEEDGDIRQQRPVATGIEGAELDAGGLGRWSWGEEGIPLIDADLLHEGRYMGRFRVYGDEGTPAGETLSCMSPLLIPAVSRLMALREAEHRATIDGLTGVLNRAGLEQRMSEELHRARRQASPICLMMLDVDGLKQTNDERGHQAGDRLLCRVADVTSSVLRSFDVVGRFGGDEFLVLLPDTAIESAVRVAARIRRYLREAPEGPQVSLGVIQAGEGESWRSLVARADKAMYEIKNENRDDVSAA